jgi:hypothetical protein
MRFQLRLNRRLLAVSGAMALLGATVGVAVGTSGLVGPDKVVHGCYNSDGRLKVISYTAHCQKGWTAIEWNQQGVQGPKGDTGAAGAIGAAGPAGSDGAQGPAGADGPQGPKGDTGAAGAAGTNGLPGAEGAPGAQGPQGEPGAAGPDGPAGIDLHTGDTVNVAIREDTSDVYNNVLWFSATYGQDPIGP